jgi:hypothetical protein
VNNRSPSKKPIDFRTGAKENRKQLNMFLQVRVDIGAADDE